MGRFGKMLYVLVSGVLVLALVPSVALAQTDIGVYNTRMAAVFGACGYDLSDYTSESGHTAANELAMYAANYPDYQYFANTFTNAANNVTYWYSSLDGFGYAFAKDAAQADIAKAIAKCADSKGGTFSGNTTGNGTDTGGSTDTGVTDDGTYVTFSAVHTGLGPTLTGFKVPYESWEKIRNLCARSGANYVLFSYGMSGTQIASDIFALKDEPVWQEFYSNPKGAWKRSSNGSIMLTRTWGLNKNAVEGYIVFTNDEMSYRLNEQSAQSFADGNILHGIRPLYDYALVDVSNATPTVVGGGGSGTTDTPTGPSYPSDNPDYPSPTVPTVPNTTLPTIGNQTETTVDLGPVTARQDVTNGLLYGIGTDLGNFYNMVWSEFDQLEAEIYDLGDYMGALLDAIRITDSRISARLSMIYDAMQELDRDTDAIDLSGVTSKLDDVIAALANVTPYDDTNLLTTIENAAYDDSALVAAITGSHGSDVLGLFGRIDIILNWLDTYTGFDDSELLVLAENIYDALNNMQNSDSNVTTIRGDVRLVADRLSSILQDFDNLMLVLEDWPDYPTMPDVSVLSDIYDELVDLGNNLVGFWGAMEDSLDAILQEIQALPHDDVEYPYEPWPTEPDGGPIIGPIEVDPYGYPMMPDWELYKEPLNIPALQQAIDELMTKFPFSMLNQLVQIAMYIKRDPVAPVFDLPMPNPSDWSAPYSVHVDLSDLDVMAAVLRLGITVWAIARISTKTIKMWMGDKAVE